MKKTIVLLQLSNKNYYIKHCSSSGDKGHQLVPLFAENTDFSGCFFDNIE